MSGSMIIVNYTLVSHLMHDAYNLYISLSQKLAWAFKKQSDMLIVMLILTAYSY